MEALQRSQKGGKDRSFPRHSVFGSEEMPDHKVKALASSCKRPHEKEIPPIVFRLKKEKLALFLNQLFTCDNRGKAGIGYATSSEKTAREIQHLLLRFGVVAKIKEKKTKRRPSFSVEIQNPSALTQGDILWDEVVSVVYIGKEPTYDLSVNPTHNFIANDIVVHNSFASKILLYRLAEKHPDLAFFIIDPESEYVGPAIELDIKTDVIKVSSDEPLGLDPLKLFTDSKSVAASSVLSRSMKLCGVIGNCYSPLSCP